MEVIINELKKSFGNLKVIDNLSLKFNSNKIHCIFGPSGCGKSTLINVMTGIISADYGTIEGLEQKKFSYVFQEERLLPWATVEENILFVLESYYKKERAKKLSDKYISLVDLSEFKTHYPDQLSGGMKQRVCIARAFAFDGDILVMDEPFKGLHLDLKKKLMNYIINYLKENNKTVFFITHDIDEALYLADSIHIFKGPPLNLKKSIKINIPSLRSKNKKEEMESLKNEILNVSGIKY
ncbi:ABC transporter ATP-binding protein [Herbivorax sp. ANBcel31]|uniref:ABC transporter ATP-binding protein n=1 Tax=Herbivorax sp. ANBcel31 TaxID=3069754 RepID=UPI0027B2DCDF|nr:ABC transporter ATP-binding protein [Herbivorax sp. ANBcel31]MDQ2085233.1 ABC transporter ATP-binding protein [Herbivorax sp. ANBcel31]